MTDIVERLLDKDGKFMSRYCKPHQLQELRVEAAAEIERQQADIDRLTAERQGWLDEVERMRAALVEIEREDHDEEAQPGPYSKIARHALAGGDGWNRTSSEQSAPQEI